MSFLFHYSHYGTIWPCFKFYVQPIPDFGANITSPCLYTPSRSRMCGFFSPFLLLYPRAALGRVAFSALSCFYTPALLLAAWLFQPFLASKPRTYHWGVAFFAVFCHLWLISQFAGRRSKKAYLWWYT